MLSSSDRPNNVPKRASLSRRGKSVEQLKELDIAERQLRVIKISQMRQQYYYKMNVCKHPKCPVIIVGQELEVLKLISEGYSNRVVGEMLSHRKAIVDGYVICLFNKLKARSRDEAVGTASNLGILP